jgi:uncharacterized protein (TIGR04255 family)
VPRSAQLSSMPEHLAHEVFPSPVVKSVAFELRFPNLFFIETRIGEFQVQVMKDFPQTELLHRRNLMFLAGPADNLQELAKQQTGDATDKVWVFKSKAGTRLEISSKNFVVSSEQHFSYKHGDEKSFRSAVQRAVEPFIKMVAIPLALRIGLRYVNECPIFSRSTEQFNECYNSILPMSRFKLEQVANMDCAVVTNMEQCQLRHVESMRLTPEGGQLVLDLDAWAENVPSENVMASTDLLYEALSTDFWNTVKQPIIDYRRKPKGA